MAQTGCSVGTKQGFGIVKWTGDGSDANRTVPRFIRGTIIHYEMTLTEDEHWLIWHKGYNDDDAAMLFDMEFLQDQDLDQKPTSNVFGVYGGQGNRGTTDLLDTAGTMFPDCRIWFPLRKWRRRWTPLSWDSNPAIFWMKAVLDHLPIGLS